MIPLFLATILTLLTLTTFTTILLNVDQAQAQTVIDPDCAVIDARSSGECDVTIDYDGNCSPSRANCDINININANPLPSGSNELKLDYILETGIDCINVPSSFRSQCLLNTLNDYDSNVNVNRGANTVSDNEFNFEGSQQVRETAGQNNFFATNRMVQDVTAITTGTTSTIDTDGDGNNVQLQYLQDIVAPDDTSNNNFGRQYVSLDATTGGDIITSDHEELGFLLQQRLINNDDYDTNQAASPITATNQAHQILGIDSDNNARITYDTNELSTISQTIENCSFSTTGTTNCLNSAGNPSITPSGQYVQLRADGAGTEVNLDDLQQTITQTIEDFEDANGADATNRADKQFIEAVAANGGEIDMDISNTIQTQSISQSITNSDEDTTNNAEQTIGIGSTIAPVEGLAEVDIDQELTQAISGATSAPSSNTGTMFIQVFSRDGGSQVFVEGFDQYLTQTADCSGCVNVGIVSSTFDVADDATFTLEPGSVQGLTQTLTEDGESNNNIVSSVINVRDDNTDAQIYLNQQISNTNGQNDGNSMFQATYNGGQDYHQHCQISTVNGPFNPTTSCSNQ
jgi:hypothetical protein